MYCELCCCPSSPAMSSFKDAIEKESKINGRMASFGCAKCTKPTARSCLWSVGVLIFFMAQVVMNVLSFERFGSFGGESVRQISLEQPTFLTPDGLTFSVWFIIYLFQGMFSIYQAIPCFQNSHAGVSRARFWVIVLYVVNCVFLVVFSHKLYWLSFLLIIYMVVSLVMIYRMMKINYGAIDLTQDADMLLPSVLLEDKEHTLERLSGSDKFSGMLIHPWPVKLLCFVGFSANLSWLVVASMMNFLIAAGHDGYHKQFTTLIQSPVNSSMIPAVTYVNGSPDFAIMAVCLVATIAFVLAIRNCDVPYAMVTIWALWGINRAQGSKAPEGFPEVAMNKAIVDWTAGMIIVILFAIVIGLVKAVIETVNARKAITSKYSKKGGGIRYTEDGMPYTERGILYSNYSGYGIPS